MRLWHIDIILYLPKSQLIAQWGELNSIYKKQNHYILINYIYNYPKDYLYCYTQKVIDGLCHRDINIKSLDNYNKYFSNDVGFYWNTLFDEPNLKYNEHNNEYLTICYYNLKEKYLRGQKDFTKELWTKLDIFYKTHLVNEKIKCI